MWNSIVTSYITLNFPHFVVIKVPISCIAFAFISPDAHFIRISSRTQICVAVLVVTSTDFSSLFSIVKHQNAHCTLTLVSSFDSID